MKNVFTNKIIFSIFDYFNIKKVKIRGDFDSRVYFLSGIWCFFLFFILFRYAWLSFFPTQIRDRVVSTGSRQFEASIKIFQPRATITDRLGRPMAISVPSTSIFLLTKKMPQDAKTLTELARQFHMKPQVWFDYKKSKKNFIWLERQVSSQKLSQLGSLKKWQRFIGVVEEPKRYYPEKTLASQLIGFVGNDGYGLEGIEKIYERRLSAVPKKVTVQRDARGHLVFLTPNAASRPDQNVRQLKLSIDLVIQELTQKALAQGVRDSHAKGGSAIVMNVKSGEILGISSLPTYDLNDPPANYPEARRFRPVMDALELGSVVKPMWIAKALDLNVIGPGTKIYADKGKLQVPGGYIHDTHPHEWLSPREIIKYSSNIGVYKVVQKIGRDKFYNAMMQIGFGRSPGTGLPGEWQGRIHPPETWSEMRFANMAFGQGIAISPLQLIHGLGIIVGGGVDRGVSILKQEDEESLVSFERPELRYISQKNSIIIAKMMTSTVEDEPATASLARIPGIQVGGKTGTAQIWNNKKHSYTDRTPVFEGFFPASDPKIAIVVVLDRVGVRPAYGATLSAPVFSRIGTEVLNYLSSKGLENFPIYKNKYKGKSQVSVVDDD